MIFDDIKSFSVSLPANNAFNIKSGIVWGHSNKTNGVYPIIYLTRPKGIPKEDFAMLMESIKIEFIKNTKEEE